MPIHAEKLLSLHIPAVRQTYNWRDSALYALGVGFGLDPMDERQLRYVDETRLRAVPTMANVLAHPGFWMRDLDTGIDWMKVVHGEQGMILHRPLPTAGTVIGETRVVRVTDKGKDKGAVVDTERVIRDADSGALLATLIQTTVCRGDGGFAPGPSAAREPPTAAPVGPPDFSIELPTHLQQALVYRLSGDFNPLHADPVVARKAGFERPILHGLATFGIACHGLMSALCGYDGSRVRSMRGRFSAPVFPGESIAVDIWRIGSGVAAFRARAVPRDVVVMAAGGFTFDSD